MRKKSEKMIKKNKKKELTKEKRVKRMNNWGI